MDHQLVQRGIGNWKETGLLTRGHDIMVRGRKEWSAGQVRAVGRVLSHVLTLLPILSMQLGEVLLAIVWWWALLCLSTISIAYHISLTYLSVLLEKLHGETLEAMPLPYATCLYIFFGSVKA